MTRLPILASWPVAALSLALYIGHALAEPAASGALLPGDGLQANPQATPGLLGNGYLGRALGIGEASGVSLGGFLVPECSWVASGGAEPGTTECGIALGLNTSVDAQQAFRIPGGTLGVEFLLSGGGNCNDAAGSVQQYTNFTAPGTLNRQQMTQLWWRQRLFEDKLMFQIGKMNGAGAFNVVLNPVVLDTPHLQDTTISDLIYVPAGLNPTLYGRLPPYPETAYGAAVRFSPVPNLYLSYGIFDRNQAIGKQTGADWLPRINDYAFHISELGYAWRLGREAMPGRVGLGGWWQTGKLFTPEFSVEDGATGFYLFSNQRLWYGDPRRDSAGLIGFLQYGRTGSGASIAKNYMGGGLTGVGLVPGRPFDNLSLGVARSDLNETPGAGAFFYPETVSNSADLAPNELMIQTTYQANFGIGTPANYWTLSAVLGYTYIPEPGQRPDLPAAHVLSFRLVALF
jgi:porin